VGSRAAANKAGKRVDLAQLPFLFPSLLVVTTTVTCNNRKRTTQSILIFFVFVLQICFYGSVFFSAAQCFLFVSPSSLFSGGGLCDQGAVGGCASVALAGKDGGE
jgi:hypothetical protein